MGRRGYVFWERPGGATVGKLCNAGIGGLGRGGYAGPRGFRVFTVLPVLSQALTYVLMRARDNAIKRREARAIR